MYLYAIVGARPRAALGKGLHGGRLSVVGAGGAHVVVERRARGEGVHAPTPRTIRAHDRVVRRIAAACASVLPFRYGSAVTDGAALRASLAPVTDAVARALELVKGCVQYTLRVHGEAARPAAVDEGSAGPGARWLGARLAARRAPEIAPVTEATRSWVRATKTVRHDRPPLVASVYHLVPRADAARYRAALASSLRTLSAVEVRVSGPWPPYAFAELQ